MKIGLLSDTHADLDTRIFHHFDGVDEIWHAGDVGDLRIVEQLEAFKPTRGVFGNIDSQAVRSAWPKEQFFQCEQARVVMTHIGGRPYRYDKTALSLLVEHRPHLFICGHSHTLLVQFDKTQQCMWLNPGACGFKGFHQVRTLLRFQVKGTTVQDMEVIELGSRTGRGSNDQRK